MAWQELSEILKQYYIRLNVGDRYTHDEEYLAEAFSEIEHLWDIQFRKIHEVKYIMLAEAPLWGKTKKYIYNPDVNNSQFFFRSDLEYIINRSIRNKAEFIECLNELGFIIVDLSPYALNPDETIINYRDMSTREYRNLLVNTVPIYLRDKLIKVSTKRNTITSVFYRYGRVKHAFNDIIGKLVVQCGLVKSKEEISEISQSGGGIDKKELRRIIKG